MAGAHGGRLLNCVEVMARLSVPKATAYRLMNQMAHVRLGRRGIRVSENELDSFIAANTEGAWETNSSGRPARRTGGTTAGTTAPTGSGSSSPSRPATAELPRTASASLNGRPTLRVVFPRTRPRTLSPTP